MAPGVGKTYAMLDEGRRRLSRGTDVVVGYQERDGEHGDDKRARPERDDGEKHAALAPDRDQEKHDHHAEQQRPRQDNPSHYAPQIKTKLI